jgi:FkbM family methyltransferase
MQPIINLLKTTGLFPFAKRVKKRIQLRKYANVHVVNLDLGEIQTVFSTDDWYSKGWFFPRYDGGRIHEPVVTDAFKKYVNEQSVVLDIGAHLGYFTCVAAKLAPHGETHAFEVDPKCISLIHRNVALNKLTNVTVNHAAVSNHDGLEKIPVLEHPNPRLSIETNAGGFIEVKAIRIDDYVSENNLSPDFVKIDVEGAEWKVLNGMKETLDRREIVLLVEVHVEVLRDHFDVDYRIIIAFLNERGFQIKDIISHRGNESEMRNVDTNTKLSGNTMLLCTKKA